MTPAPVHDHSVNVKAAAALVGAVQRDQGALERFCYDRRSLAAMGERLFRLAFPRPDDVTRLTALLASAVRGAFTLRLWLHAEAEAALLPWEYLCLTPEAVAECRRQGYALDRHQPADERTFLALHPNVSLVRRNGDVEPGGE